MDQHESVPQRLNRRQCRRYTNYRRCNSVLHPCRVIFASCKPERYGIR